MSKLARTFILLLALASLLVAGTAEAKKKPAKPSAREKADARVFYNASLVYRSQMAVGGATIDSEIDTALAACPTALEGATAEQVTALKDEVGYILFVREAVVIHKTFADKIAARKSKNKTLRQIVAGARKTNAEFTKVSTIVVDPCVLGESWKAAAFAADFLDDWFVDQLSAVDFDLIGYAGLSVTVTQTRPKLIRLGLTKAQATSVINATLLN